ncbi:hypothetical protein CEXT_229961 [Caerostris extrusa]|uniref:Uncharacterized protein n=1 Tax=Caerostris extrusa TaxID=172846 RepID=A0AAV4UJ75_CAEEX|nr:hypothetical protein CEXT_229961 [Caerostris extrusa]
MWLSAGIFHSPVTVNSTSSLSHISRKALPAPKDAFLGSSHLTDPAGDSRKKNEISHLELKFSPISTLDWNLTSSTTKHTSMSPIHKNINELIKKAQDSISPRHNKTQYWPQKIGEYASLCRTDPCRSEKTIRDL